jgi:hypothetical protein
MYVNCPEEALKGNFTTKGDCSDQVHSDQMVLRTVRQEAKALKAKQTQGGPSGLSTPRSDGSHDGQAGGWTS